MCRLAIRPSRNLNTLQKRPPGVLPPAHDLPDILPLALFGSHGDESPKKDFRSPKTKSLSSHLASTGLILYLIDPPSDMERAIFELDAIGLAAEKKFDGILADERHVSQVQNQLLPRCLDGEQLLELLDILRCFDPAAEREQNSTIRCSPSS